MFTVSGDHGSRDRRLLKATLTTILNNGGAANEAATWTRETQLSLPALNTDARPTFHFFVVPWSLHNMSHPAPITSIETLPSELLEWLGEKKIKPGDGDLWVP